MFQNKQRKCMKSSLQVSVRPKFNQASTDWYLRKVHRDLAEMRFWRLLREGVLNLAARRTKEFERLLERLNKTA